MNNSNNVPAALTYERPISYSGALSDFQEGRLCFVKAVRYQGAGPVRIILHEATISPDGKGYSYGADRHWTIGAGTLLGGIDSEKRRNAARQNGKKGGRKPKTEQLVNAIEKLAIAPINPKALAQELESLVKEKVATIKAQTRTPIFGGLLKPKP